MVVKSKLNPPPPHTYATHPTPPTCCVFLPFCQLVSVLDASRRMDGSGAPEAAQGAEERARAGSDVNVEERTSTRVAVRRLLQQELDDSRDLPRLREEAHADRQPGAPTASNTQAEDAGVGRGRSVQCCLPQSPLDELLNQIEARKVERDAEKPIGADEVRTLHSLGRRRSTTREFRPSRRAAQWTKPRTSFWLW